MNKADGKHSSDGGVALEYSFHPILIFCAGAGNEDDVAFPERQLIFVVCRTII